MFALIFNGAVVQIEAATFPVHSSLEWIDVSGITPAPEPNWTYDGQDFAAPVIPPKPAFVPSIEDDLLTLAQSVSTTGEKLAAQVRIDSAATPGRP